MGIAGVVGSMSPLALAQQQSRSYSQLGADADRRAMEMYQQAYLGTLDPMAYQNRQNATSVLRQLQAMPYVTQPKKPNPDRVAAIKELEESGIDVSEMSVYD